MDAGKPDDAGTNIRALIFALLALASGHMLSTLLRTIPAISLDLMAADFATPPQTLASLTSIYHFAFAASQMASTVTGKTGILNRLGSSSTQ